jgi:serine/threonine protein kinase
MNPEQWSQVKDLCAAVLAQSVDERVRYLKESCSDKVLLDEVCSLLSFEPIAQKYLSELSSELVAAALLPDGSLIGVKIGNYLIQSLLGRGGMGEVYLAEDIELKRQVALKVLPKGLPTDEQPLQRFKQEARAASGLKHRNILTIYGVGQDEGIYFIATEYVPGLTLRQRLASGRLKQQVAIDISMQIASALESAHRAGVVHRDVKPENIIFEPDGTAKLLDFGIAKLMENLATESIANELPKTEQGVVLGTPAYMSPEQARHQSIDHRTDLFSLGVVLYEMITGKVPFSGLTPYDQQAAVLVTDPTPIRDHLDIFIPELQWVIGKALTKDPDRRYQTATDLLIDLQLLNQRVQSEDALQERPVGKPIEAIELNSQTNIERIGATNHRRFNRRPLALICISLVVCISSLIIWLTGAGRRVAALAGLHGPAPVIEAIIPNRPIDIIGDQPIEVRGRNFQDGLKLKVEFSNGESSELSGSQIRKQPGNDTFFHILVDFNGNPGTYRFLLLNSDGQVSPRFSFDVRHETQRPIITWIEPANPKTSGSEQPIAVYGQNFQIGLKVEVIQPNGDTSELKDRQITNRTSTSFHGLFFLHRPGKHSIRAVNPNGGKSEYFDIFVQ